MCIGKGESGEEVKGKIGSGRERVAFIFIDRGGREWQARKSIYVHIYRACILHVMCGGGGGGCDCEDVGYVRDESAV